MDPTDYDPTPADDAALEKLGESILGDSFNITMERRPSDGSAVWTYGYLVREGGSHSNRARSFRELMVKLRRDFTAHARRHAPAP